MPQSLAQVYVHIVLSTKNRVPFLSDPAIRKEFFRFSAFWAYVRSLQRKAG